ncbi:hypothetical protein PILCRDRAFT_8054 [Piloderma croceum F 1598]|uniref:Uncharacterized protein n=1 Tax=Piloderma croceum (strain F 1598) TaxID=765440 RepID=A0A0C3FC85_PILCF|nr:hypothetical protein PILCRDRAFT_8054 [Piloderma croceum F 1598]
MDALTQFSDRWRDVRFIIPPSMLNSLATTKNTFSRLQSLAIAFPLEFRFMNLTVDAIEYAPSATLNWAIWLFEIIEASMGTDNTLSLGGFQSGRVLGDIVPNTSSRRMHPDCPT